MTEGIITKGIGGLYNVDAAGKTITCRARGKFRKDNRCGKQFGHCARTYKHGISDYRHDGVVCLPRLRNRHGRTLRKSDAGAELS